MPRIGMSRVHGSAAGVAGAGWFGDGSDGDLTVAAGQTLALDVAEDEGQIVKQYGNLTIEVGATLRPAHRCNGMILLVNGDLVVEGTISVDKCAPLLNNLEEVCLSEPHIKLCGSLTGGAGGAGSKGASNYTPGNGGEPFAFGGGYGGGGAGSRGNGGTGDRPPVGSPIPYPGIAEGSGTYGAGGGAEGNNAVGGGGPGGSGAISYVYHYQTDLHMRGLDGDAFGGGAAFIFVKGRVRIGANGRISANGGNGANGLWGKEGHYNYSTYGGSGGGGGGGIIALVHTGDYINSGSIAASGGNGGEKAPSTTDSIPGNGGSMGTVLIATLSELLQV